MAPAPSKNASTKSKPHGRKRSAEATEYAAAADDDTFEVEDVIGRRFNRGGVEYLIRWKGYSEEHNTWEPAVNLSDAALELAEQFSPGGHQLSPYEQARLDRIRRNEERLASLGLFDVKKKPGVVARGTGTEGNGPRAPQKSRPTRASAVTPSPTRSSRRFKLEPERYEPVLYDDIGVFFRRVKRKTSEGRPSGGGFKCDVPTDVTSSPLTEDEKAVLKTKIGGDFLGKFEDYLTQIDTISDQNRRNVLRQITKLASGEGIRYESHAYGWPEGCYFLGGVKVGPTDDILKLMDMGRECEERWGKDHGNGWLLSHPLKKLYMFQQYHLQKD